MIRYSVLKQRLDRSSFSTFRFPVSVLLCGLCGLCVLCGSITAQVRPIYDQGALGLGQLLKRLNNTKSVLMIGAHPDDEDSGLLAYLARGENARTAYLSLTRGDGGQNRLGKELFEPLGIIRTEELLQARTLDGAEQYFTRAFDYGYSKTLAEAKSKWDEKVILCDVVRVIRSFRPLVVISRFSGTPRDGHGQHQFAGYISKPAVDDAADSNQCKDSGVPWKVKKFYRSFRGQNVKPTVRMNTGKYDPLLGRSYFQIAIQGRSQHKSQEQGFLELRGDRFSSVIAVGEPKEEKSIFDGIDTSIAGLPTLSNAKATQSEKFYNQLRRISKQTDQLNAEFQLKTPNKLSALLFSVMLDTVRIAVTTTMNAAVDNIDGNIDAAEANKTLFNLLKIKLPEISNALLRSSGVKIDVLSNLETITRGESFTTSVKIFIPKDSNIKVKKVTLKTPKGWQVSEGKEVVDNSRFGRFFRETADESRYFNVTVGEKAKTTQPYFLEKPRKDAMYDAVGSESFQPPLMSADVTVEIEGETTIFNQPVEFRMRDQLRGELRRNLNIVPKIALDIDQHLLIVPQSSKPQKRTVSVNLLCNSSEKASGKAMLNVPKGWRVSPSTVDFDLNRKGESTSAEFEVTVPADTKAGSYKLGAVAKVGDKKFDQTMNVVAYDHIQTHRYYTKAETKVNVFDLKTSQVKIGYIMGSGDQIPEAIRQMGYAVELLSKKDLTSGDFSKFNSIVVGIRASETRPDYIANNERLHEYVRQGGTLIVQYQKFAYLRQKLNPFPATLNARVAEEDAKVTILEPSHPVFNYPNKIGERDFDNWVQERNLYAFKTFDERYTPLLEAHDTGEVENKGGMLYAEIGKGKFMYCSYSFFRQLPAGVPGAYRLFSNMLSLPKAKK